MAHVVARDSHQQSNNKGHSCELVTTHSNVFDDTVHRSEVCPRLRSRSRVRMYGCHRMTMIGTHQQIGHPAQMQTHDQLKTTKRLPNHGLTTCALDCKSEQCVNEPRKHSTLSIVSTFQMRTKCWHINGYVSFAPESRNFNRRKTIDFGCNPSFCFLARKCLPSARTYREATQCRIIPRVLL